MEKTSPSSNIGTSGVGGPEQSGAELRSAGDRLDSWKEIAVYLKRDVRTVQRWEKSERLPIHRHAHRRQGSVFAFRAELDAWWLQRSLSEPATPPPEQDQPIQPEPAALEASMVCGSTAQPAELPAPALLLPSAGRGTGWRQVMIGTCIALLGIALLAINFSRDHLTRKDYAAQHPAESKAEVGTPPIQAATLSVPPHQMAAHVATRHRSISLPQEAARFAEQLRRVVVVFDKDSHDFSGDGVGIWRFSLRHPSSSAPIIAAGGIDTGPQFSPDGRQIAFSSDRSGSREIWLANSDGSHPVQLTRLQSFLTSTPRWSPDGKWIAFDSIVEGAPEIFMVSSRGGEPRRLARADNEGAVVPSWSKDGRSIYYSAVVNGEFEVMKLTLDRSTPEQITRHGGFSPQESADGKFLYYAKKTQPGLWRMNVTGDDEQLVLPDLPAGYWGYWQLAGKGIYYVTPAENELAVLHYYDLRTKRSHDLGSLTKSAVDGDPGLSVSKDGEWVLCAQRGNYGRLEASASTP